MKKTFILLGMALLLVSLTQKADAQSQYYFYNDKYYDADVVYEIGASLGIMNCLTDVGGRKGIGKKFIKDLNWGKTQFCYGITLGFLYKDAVGLRLEYNRGQITADDKVLESVKETTFGRYERNLSFRSKISEFMMLSEIHPLNFFPKMDDDREPSKISPYLLAGAGLLSFNPQAKYNGKWIDLQPLSTEGQGFKEYSDRKKYKLNQLTIPVGLGLRYELSPYLNLRGEFLYRILNTDYLDDVSTTYIDPTLYYNYFTGTKLNNALAVNARQKELDPSYIVSEGDQRGNPSNNDAYFTFNLKIAYSFGRPRIK